MGLFCIGYTKKKKKQMENANRIHSNILISVCVSTPRFSSGDLTEYDDPNGVPQQQPSQPNAQQQQQPALPPRPASAAQQGNPAPSNQPLPSQQQVRSEFHSRIISTVVKLG